MIVEVFVEGGGDDTSLKRRCRREFSRFLRQSVSIGQTNRLIITASGSRNQAFDQFKTTSSSATTGGYTAMMLVDSEDPVTNIERTWLHLRLRDGWAKPSGATDDQVLFMTTSMETWIATDREALRRRFPRDFNENPLPALSGVEDRPRNDVFNALRRATNNRYSKGKISFELLGNLDPDTMAQHLPSFRRARRILNEKLGSRLAG